jgi:nitrate ABC transporter ATP-binding subunit
MNKHLEIRNVTKVYSTPAGPAVIVRNFDLFLDQGEFVSLIGHSGCGKSTVLSMVAGLCDITMGTIVLAGREIDGPGCDRGVIFEAPCLLHWMTVIENVVLGVEQVYPQKTHKEHLQIAAHHLRLVGLEKSMFRKPRELSSGMQQRVGLARAFALSPELLLLDEPFGMLDSLARFELREVLMDRWTKDQKTALMVTHDVDEALLLSDRIAMMTNGPAATIAEIVEVPFPRPRNRRAMLDDPRYYALREHLLMFLEDQLHRRPPVAESSERCPVSFGSEPDVLPLRAG